MVEEGTALEDVCKVTGNPIKSVQWLKDGKDTNQSIPLTKSDNGNYTLKVDGHQSIVKGLTIHIMCKYHGNYICFLLFFLSFFRLEF